jgi:transposase-like protein
MKKVHLAVRSASREYVQTLIREALEPGFKSMAQGLFRSQVESMFDHALQAELAEHLGRTPYERNGQGPWRNGSKTVALPSPLGALSVEKPVLRKGGFRSSLLSLLRDGMDQAIEVICQRTWLRGLSTRAVASEMRELTGAKLSASDISEMTDKLLPSIDQWRRQPIAPVRILYLDALYIPVRRGGETSKQAVLVAIGVDDHRMRHFLGWLVGDRETTESWNALLADLKDRGLGRPALVVSDAHKAIRAAVASQLGVDHQLCVVHKMRAILSQVQRVDQKAFSEDFKAIFWADGRHSARNALAKLQQSWGKTYPKLVAKAGDEFEDFTRFFDQPQELWGLCRCSNIIERFNEELRRRLDPSRIAVADKSLDKIVHVVATEQQKRWDRQKLPSTHLNRLRRAA